MAGHVSQDSDYEQAPNGYDPNFRTQEYSNGYDPNVRTQAHSKDTWTQAWGYF